MDVSDKGDWAFFWGGGISARLSLGEPQVYFVLNLKIAIARLLRSNLINNMFESIVASGTALQVSQSHLSPLAYVNWQLTAYQFQWLLGTIKVFYLILYYISHEVVVCVFQFGFLCVL